ncbi:MAG TPA: hypothetical protein VFD74_05080, partial [Thermoleophilia bacterium]|nr:hypothetical protein [Thermoleophilia bacterium]
MWAQKPSTLGGGYRVDGRHRRIVREEQGRRALSELEGHVVGEHAQEHMGADPGFRVMVDGTDQKLGGLHLAKGVLAHFE